MVAIQKETYFNEILKNDNVGKNLHIADPEVGTGGPDPPPMKNHKNIGFFRNTGPNPMNNLKATKSAFNVGPSSARQRNAI